MTDKLNNLIETDSPEEGGYYRAGLHSLWDIGLTPGELYMIHPVSELGFSSSDLRALDTSEFKPFCIHKDNGDPVFMSTIAIQLSKHAKLYKNPASA